ncbi:MAG: ABC transporter permease [Bacillota bacterium]|nr:ABC transporter permease [Bacillota bacterium]MDW7677863.1 ABC transporter permease [Bacillota bacterium]
MKTALKLAGFHIVQKLKKPGWWIISILVPLLMIFLLAAGFSGFFEEGLFLEPFEVVLINQDTHPVIQMIEEQLIMDDQIGRLVVLTPMTDEEAARNRLQKREITAVVILPEGMISALEAGDNREIELLLNPDMPFEGRLVRGIMEHFMKSVSGGQSAVYTVWDYYGKIGLDTSARSQKINPVIQDITLRAYRTRDQLIEPVILPDLKNMDPIQYYGTAMIVLFVMFLSLQESRLWLNENQHGLKGRLLMTGISRPAYMAAQFLRIFFLAVIQTMTISGILLAFKVVPWELTEGMIFLYGGMIFAASSLALLLGIIVKEEESYQVLLNSVLLLGALLGGGLIPLHYMPVWMQRTAQITINYWVLTGSFALLNGEVQRLLWITLGLILVGSVTLIISLMMMGRQSEEQ